MEAELDICFFMELDKRRKNIQTIFIKNVCFDPLLCSGVGTIVKLTAILIIRPDCKLTVSENDLNCCIYFATLFLTTLFSSSCLYFDQKLTIIPLICFFQIIFSR